MKTELTRRLETPAKPAAFRSDPAANDDHLVDGPMPRPADLAWTPYEVWKKFIKDARDRRELGLKP
jgi:hypothetical protein